jgi:G6PDH family F420-dependent oxidoreductase
LSSEEHDPRALVRHAALAETTGFATAMISDHLRPWVRRQGNASHVWTVLGAIATATSAIEVGTGVSAMVHRYSPIALAHSAATAAVMFEGRFFLGLGSGERLNEQGFGERWPRAGERRASLAEGIGLIRSLCSGDNVIHRGESWSVENLSLATIPATAPPIYIAAGGKLGAKLAADMGDGLIGTSPDNRLIDVFRTGAGAEKRCLAQVHISIATTLDAAVDNAWEWWPNGVVPPAVLGELARPEEFEAIACAVGRGSITEIVVCATDAAPVIAAIDRFIGAGFDTVYIHQVGPDQGRLAALAAGELLPHYRGTS